MLPPFFIGLIFIKQGPVVQSTVSLTKLLVDDPSYSTHENSCGNIFAEKSVRSFCTAKAPHTFSTKNDVLLKI